MKWMGMATLALGVLVAGGVARAQQADALRPPENVNAEPSSPQSAELTTRAATAEMKGDPHQAVQLADKAIAANPKDPWPYYDKGMALARMGEVDGAIAALDAAEQHFSLGDAWGRSVAVFGRAHVLAETGRCEEARPVFEEYIKLAQSDPDAVALAQRYSRDCRPPAGMPATPPAK
ncbi:MAG TPA: tetratricopeptide repeat protein [Polyangia bacterium]|nr:tetratricopeptide repeat protein [Polyangia bacterium]